MKKSNTFQKCEICKTEFRLRPSLMSAIKTCSKACSAIRKSRIGKGRKLTKVWRQRIGKANAIALKGHKNSDH